MVIGKADSTSNQGPPSSFPQLGSLISKWSEKPQTPLPGPQPSVKDCPTHVLGLVVQGIRTLYSFTAQVWSAARRFPVVIQQPASNNHEHKMASYTQYLKCAVGTPDCFVNTFIILQVVKPQNMLHLCVSYLSGTSIHK